MKKTRTIWATLLLAACQLPPQESGESYTLQGDPWAAKPADPGTGGGSGGGGGTGGTSGSVATPAATATEGGAGNGGNAAAANPALPSGSSTVLEQLDEARARVKTLDAENQLLKGDVAAQVALIEQLRAENRNLAQLADSNAQSRATLDQQIAKLEEQQTALEARYLALADDILAERILRVRVERELILAKVKEAENKDGGP